MNRRFVLAVAGCAIALTLWYTWPIAAQLPSHVAGRSVDAEQFLWSYWWFREALTVQHSSPFWTDLLYFPEGVSLRYFTTNTLHALVSIPLQLIFGLPATFNLIGLAIFVATCASMTWLAYELSGSHAGALIGGIAFAFAPTQIFHWRVGQFNMLSVEFLPVYILCLYRVLHAQAERWPWRWILAAAAALACAALSDWQFAIYLGLFSLLAVGAMLIGSLRRWQAILGPSAVVAALAVIVLLPYILPMLSELASDNYMLRSDLDTLYHAADVKAFLVPNPASPFWADWSARQLAPLADTGIVQTVVSLSFVTLALAIIGALLRWRQARFWLFVGGVFWVLSLGPRLKWFGTITEIGMPYLALFQLKIMQVSRFPARFAMITQICLAIVAALGVAALLQRRDTAAQARRWPRPALIVVAGVALIAELLPAPNATEPLAPAPSFFSDGSLAGAGAIVEQPNPSNRGMYFQTLHGRPVLWGELSRDNPAGPLLAFLRTGPAPRQQEIFDAPRDWLCAAAALRITHYVRYASTPRRPPEGTTLLRAEEGAELYRIEDPGEQATCLALDRSWQAISKLEDGTVYRWIGQDARLGLLRRRPGAVRLSMHIHCFAGPRRVQLRQGEALVAEAPACGWPPQPLVAELELPAGWTWLQLASVEPASNPVDFGYPDNGPIAVGVSRLTAEPR
jgi:hypothetical protein